MSNDHMILRGDSKELLEFMKSVGFNKTKRYRNVIVKAAEVVLLSFPFQDQSALLLSQGKGSLFTSFLLPAVL